jgi:hypothetical protein
MSGQLVAGRSARLSQGAPCQPETSAPYKFVSALAKCYMNV